MRLPDRIALFACFPMVAIVLRVLLLPLQIDEPRISPGAVDGQFEAVAADEYQRRVLDEDDSK